MAINSLNVLVALQQGKNVKCQNCGDGYYIPIGNNIDIKQCCHFKCEKCGTMFIATKKLKI